MSHVQRQWSTVILIGLAMSMLLVLANKNQVDAAAIAAPSTGSSQQQAPAMQGIGEATNSPLDKFISDLFDEAGERLKKSRMNSMKGVKQTLRFGRRSDPSLFTESPDAFDLQRLVPAYRLQSSLQELLQDDSAHDPVDEWHRQRYLANAIQGRPFNE